MLAAVCLRRWSRGHASLCFGARINSTTDGGACRMSKTGCRVCRNVRIVLLSVLLGGGGGFLVLRYGASAELSMLVTFVGAIAPLLWTARRRRLDDEGRR